MKRIWKWAWLEISILLIALCGACATRGLPPQHGILNFDQVDQQLYRGAQPGYTGLEHLHSIGVKSIVNLRETGDVWPEESEACLDLGLSYTNIPMSGVWPPSRERVKRIIATLEALPKPIFVHCQHGADRTGLIVACWHLTEDPNWTPTNAAREAKQYGASPLLPCFHQFILNFQP